MQRQLQVPCDPRRRSGATPVEIMTVKESLQAKADKTLFVNPLKNVVTYLKVKPKLATGVKFFDKVTNGGMSEGELALVAGLSGGGKCLAKDTPVLMFDGSIRAVQDIQIGDRLMGMDSTPRTVIQLGRGRSEMCRVVPVNGDSFTVNKYHILSLICTGNIVFGNRKYRKGDIIDIPVSDILRQGHTLLSKTNLFRTGVDFPPIEDPELDPYFVGLYLGSGRRVLPEYKFGSRKVRLSVLAGIVDAVGKVYDGSSEISIESNKASEDIVFIARSLGYAAYIRSDYVKISGDFTDLPVRIEKHKIMALKQAGNVLQTGYTLEWLPEDDYYGFVIDGDHRFLLGDFTVTHNTAIAIQLVGSQLLLNNPTAWFTYEQPFDQDLMQRLVSFTTGYSLDIIRGKEFYDLPEQVRERFSAVAKQTADKMIATDFTSNDMLDKDDPEDDGSPYSIDKRLTIWKREKGYTPQYLMFDWLGAAVRRLAAVRNVDIGQISNYQNLGNEIIEGLIDIAKKFGTRIVMFHQLEPGLKKSPPSRKPTSVELQMIKSATNYVQYGMALGKRDENQRCWFVCDKCRNSYPSEVVIELDGEHAKFNLLDGYAPDRNGQFVNISEIIDEMDSSAENSYRPVI